MSETAGDGKATIDINPETGAAPPDTGGADFSSMIPEGFKDKPYMKDIDSVDKLFSSLDGAQQLIGKREDVIPKEGDPQEKFDAFFKLQGRPETADKYEFTHPEGLERDEAFMKTMSEAMHKHGLSQKQAAGMQGAFDEMTAQTIKANDEGFEKLAADTFEGKEEKVMEVAKKLLEDHTPEALKPHISTLGNKELVIMAGVLDSIANKYISEDTLGKPEGASSASTSQELRAQLRTVMLDKDYTNKWGAQHDVLVSKATALSEQIAKVEGGK